MKLYMAVVEENGCVRAHDFIEALTTDKVGLFKHICVTACSGEFDLAATVIQDRIKEVNELWTKMELSEQDLGLAILKLQSLAEEADDTDNEELEEDILALLGEGVVDGLRLTEDYLSNIHSLFLGEADKMEEVSEEQTLLLAVINRD